ncbi:MAG: GGDEF domain-containing response regulator [Gammaproteobacteria bacterium]
MSPTERAVILAVDDEPENLDLLERTLGVDYDVRVAHSGAEALEILGQLSDVALIITDQRMPGMTGTEFLSKARLRRADAVRMIVTGYTSPADLIDAINSSNVFRFVTKPWDIDHMLLVVRRAIRIYEAGGGDLLDEVTGLPNRGLLRRELEREVARAARTSQPLALKAIRITGYADYAASRGPTAAERLLASLADSLRAALRKIDLLGVHADDVFLAVLPECATSDPVSDRVVAAAHLRGAVREALEGSPALCIAVDEARMPEQGTSARDLLQALALES